jgi:hypothetical protein
MHRSEGLLIDISESGALVRQSAQQTPDTLISLILDWNDESVLLRGRVVRSVPYRMELLSGVLARIEHLVASEFVDIPEKSASALRRVILSVVSS